ncbi:MAG: DUF2784 domain-containing protein [Bacillota bacterium]
MFEETTYALLADITAAVHFLYLFFVVFAQVYIMVGYLFFWPLTRSFWFRSVHFVMVLVVSIQEMLGLRCPLTVLEYHLRLEASQDINTEATFLMTLIRRTMFFSLPDWMFTFMYVGFGGLVALVYFTMPPRFKRIKKPEAVR